MGGERGSKEEVDTTRGTVEQELAFDFFQRGAWEECVTVGLRILSRAWTMRGGAVGPRRRRRAGAACLCPPSSFHWSLGG